MLEVLKYVGVFSAGIWGIISLLVEYKSEDGKITKWGKRALIGGVFSIFLAIITMSIENDIQRQASKQENEK